MFTFRSTVFIALAGAVLAGCTQTADTPSRAQITADPVMTKYDSPGPDGGGGCPGGGQQTAGASGTPCLPYDDPQRTPQTPRVPGQPQSGGGGNSGGGQQGGRP
ncbi:MAG: hypothetical protein ACE369_05640 [Roseovarius sp.]